MFMFDALLGTFINCGLVIIGTICGLIFKRDSLKKIGERIFEAFALLVITMGIAGSSDLSNIYLILASIILGVGLGEFFDIDGCFGKFAHFLQSKLAKGDDSTFAKGLIESTLLFCIGSLAIVGSLESGMTGDHTILITKGILDGITACMLSMSLGVGVGFAAIFVLLYQGILSLGASILYPILSVEIIACVSTIGNMFLIAVGLNMLNVTKIKVANFLPAIFIPVFYGIIQFLF